MTKTYVTPEVEIKKFAVENIMNGSAVNPTAQNVYGANDAANGVGQIDYADLFNI